jgi:hypothetical protein
MNHSHAAGRKTEIELRPIPVRYQSGALERHVEVQLGLMTEAMRAAFKRADSFALDEIVEVRAAEFSHAVNLAKTTAELLLAVGKMRGEFNQNVTVSRTSEAKADAASRPRVMREDAVFYDDDIELTADEKALFTMDELRGYTPEEIQRRIPLYKARLLDQPANAAQEPSETAVRGDEGRATCPP